MVGWTRKNKNIYAMTDSVNLHSQNRDIFSLVIILCLPSKSAGVHCYVLFA